MSTPLVHLPFPSHLDDFHHHHHQAHQKDGYTPTWASYNNGAKHPIFVAAKSDVSGTHLYNPPFSIYASTMESVAHSYLEEEGVWIIPKQNKLRLGCTLEGSLADVIKGIFVFYFL